MPCSGFAVVCNPNRRIRCTAARLAAYAGMIMALTEMVEWIEAARAEPADIEELEVEY